MEVDGEKFFCGGKSRVMPVNYVDNVRQNFSHTTKSMGIRVCKHSGAAGMVASGSDLPNISVSSLPETAYTLSVLFPFTSGIC